MKVTDSNFRRLTIADESYSSNFRWLMVWSTEVTGLTSVDFEIGGSYHFPGNFRRPGKADGSYLIFIGPDGSFCHYCSDRRRKSIPETSQLSMKP
jgi:hypothetical protein